MEQQPFLVWPKFGPRDLILLVIIMTAFTVPFVMLAFYRIRENRRKGRWILVANFATKQGLDLRESGLLKAFFDSVSAAEQEAVIHDRGRFRSLLYAYLRQHREFDERAAVRAIDKMFPDIKHWHAVLSPSDLQSGEFCGLEFGPRHIMGTVLDIEEDAIVVSFAPDSPYPGKTDDVGLYIFRPRIGGYILHTRVERLWRGGMKLLFMGKIEDQGDQHLMARINVPLEFTPWSDLPVRPEQEALDVQSNATFEEVLSAGEDEVSGDAPLAGPEQEAPVTGTSERISDRGILFVSNDPRLQTFLVHGLWELNAFVADGFQITCRGRILPTRPGTDRYVFRYIDLSENAKHVLVAEIVKRGGEREQLV